LEGLGPAQAPVGVGKISAYFVFKTRIAKNGLENHFVRESGLCEELHNPPIPGNEILDIGAGIVRQRPPSSTCVRFGFVAQEVL
jgi:hypothetical protein